MIECIGIHCYCYLYSFTLLYRGIIVVLGIVSVTIIVCIIVQVRRHGYERIENGNNDPTDNRGNVPPRKPGGPLNWTLLANKDSDVTDQEE